MTSVTTQLKALSAIDDRYEVYGPIGSGGFSTVFKGKQRKLQRMVAIKVLHPHFLNDEEHTKRFEQESQIVAGMNHPSIAAVYDYGVLENEQQYLVMELLEGKTLNEFCHEQVDSEQLLTIFIQVADALEAAHQHGLIHRDIKPGNIFITEKNDKRAVKLIDFGLAKVVENTEAGLSLTETGKTLGTPIYMSPEQCQGHKLDKRCDMYSLGGVMYEAFTGERPYNANTQFEWMYAHIRDKPRAFNLTKYGKSVSPRVEAIILKAMAKKPEDRYQTMLELKADLEKALKQVKQGTTLAERIRIWQLRRKAQNQEQQQTVSTTAKIAAITVGLTFAAAITWIVRSAPTPPPIPPMPTAMSSGEAVLMNPASMQQSPQASLPGMQLNVAPQLMAQNVEQLRKQFQQNPQDKQIAERLCHALNDYVLCLRANGQWGEAEQQLQEAIGIEKKVLGGDNPETARSLAHVAFDGHHSPQQMERLLRQADVILAKSAPNSLSRTQNIRFAADFYLTNRMPDKMIGLMQTAIQIDTKENRKEVAAEDYRLLAAGLAMMGQHKPAVNALFEGIRLRNESGLHDAIITGAMYELAAQGLAELRDYKQAETNATTALSIAEKARGPNSFEANHTRYILGRIQTYAGQKEQGKQNLVIARQFFSRLDPHGHAMSDIDSMLSR